MQECVNFKFLRLDFREAFKKQLVYALFDSSDCDLALMPALSFTSNSITRRTVVTITSEGKETENIADVGDVIMCGPSKEKYVLSREAFYHLYSPPASYQRSEVLPEFVTPARAPKSVARYFGVGETSLVASWGELMVVNPGDYIARYPRGVDECGNTVFHYARIAAKEFEDTYYALA
jgi:hypothetical protein